MRQDNSKYNFLIIEDNPGDFYLISEFLEEMIVAPTIMRAQNYRMTREILEAREMAFDIILLDITLSDNEGVSLVNDILSLAEQIPVIVLTGYEDLDFSIHSLSLGVTDYLLKDEINAFSLYKSVLFSIERKKFIRNIQESEKRYQDLFNSSPIPMWVFDVENQLIQDVNQAAINHYGYSKAEFLEMQIVDLLVSSTNLDLATPELLVEKQEPNTSEFYKHQKKNGEVIDVKIEMSTVNFNGNVACVMLANDVTELLHTQESLRSAYENIVVIEEKEKERFAGEIHDGIAQNLVAIQLIFSMIESSFPELKNHPHTEMLQTLMSNAVKECKDLVHDVRPKELLDSGFDFVLDQLIVKTEVAGQLQIESIREVLIDHYFDHKELFNIYRIIQESFNNCIKHAYATELIVHIYADANFVYIELKDNGDGIAEEIRLAPSSFLSLKRRIQLLNGFLKIESQEGIGSSFLFTIPIKKGKHLK